MSLPTGGDNYSNPGSPLRSVRTTDDNLPVLDEALALAEDLTNLVRGEFDQKTSFLEMLESMSNLIDARECNDNVTDRIVDLEEEPGLLSGLNIETPRTTDEMNTHSRAFALETGAQRGRRRYASRSPHQRHIKFYHETSGDVEIVRESSSKDGVDENPPAPVKTPLQENTGRLSTRNIAREPR